MSRLSRRAWYERVNAAWPAEPPPKLTDVEAVRATKRLYRFVRGRNNPYPIRLTSGNRRTWLRHGALVVNPEKGWHALIHYLSHLWGGGHGSEHARLERRMIKEVVRRGWLAGKLRDQPKPPPPPAPDPKLVRYQRTVAAIGRWTAKRDRAERALKKLERRKRYYDRSAA